MSKNDTISKTLFVALALCLVCSIVVSTAAVMLKPAQEVNKTLDRKYNILAAADLIEGKARKATIEEKFAQIETRAVDLTTGKFTDQVDVKTFDPKAASKDRSLSSSINELGVDDIAKIGRRSNIALVYLVKGDNGYEKIILPIHGYGLWSTLYGFLALEGDYNTVVGIGFNEHGETPGLGGEVDNPKWKALWEGKKVYDADGAVKLQLAKGRAEEGDVHHVDGLSGATLTSKGVSNLVLFWLGEQGYAPFLNNLKNGEA